MGLNHFCDKLPENADISEEEGVWYMNAGTRFDEQRYFEIVWFCPFCGKELKNEGVI